ncbi:MAG: hypothetical protein ACQ9ET_00150 [Nitrosomonadaceae bacterium]
MHSLNDGAEVAVASLTSSETRKGFLECVKLFIDLDAGKYDGFMIELSPNHATIIKTEFTGFKGDMPWIHKGAYFGAPGLDCGAVIAFTEKEVTLLDALGVQHTCQVTELKTIE